MSKRRYAPIDPVFRIPNIPVNDEMLVQRAIDRFEIFSNDRSEWIARREEFYLGWDDYLSNTRKGLWDGSSNYHLPTTEIQCSAMHARLMQALFFTDPIFYIDPQEDVDADRVHKIEAFMKYIVTRGSNYNRGIYNVLDAWCWDVVTQGMGVLSRDWVIDQRRFIDIERNEEFLAAKLDLDEMLSGEMDQEDFKRMADGYEGYAFTEVEKIRTVFNGSMVKAIDPSLILFKGLVVDTTDLNLHDTVIVVNYVTEDELMAYKESGFFDADAVDAILSTGFDLEGSGYSTRLNSGERAVIDAVTGVKTSNSMAYDNRYEMLTVYDNVKLNTKAKHRDRLVYNVHVKSGQLARWTFLDRVSSTGKINLHLGHLYSRPRSSIGRGMVETQWTAAEVTDVLLNQAIDAGIYQNNPMLKMRSDSTFASGEMKIEPGTIVSVDDPLKDLIPINFSSNPTWGVGLMQFIQSYATQNTSLGPQALGQIAGRVGPMRSTSGLESLNQQASIQLDVVIKRIKLSVSELLEGLYEDNVERMPDSMIIPLLGEEGIPKTDIAGKSQMLVVDRADLRAKIHFGLYANSQNMNKLMQKQNLQEAISFLIQQVGMQTQIVNADNIYNLYDSLLQMMGIQNRQRFITPPPKQNPESLERELISITQGIMPKIVVMDPAHQEKIEAMQALLNTGQAEMQIKFGKVHVDAIALLEKAIETHAQYLEVMQKPQQQQNIAGMQQRGQGEGEVPQEGEQDVSGEQPSNLINAQMAGGQGE